MYPEQIQICHNTQLILYCNGGVGGGYVNPAPFQSDSEMWSSRPRFVATPCGTARSLWVEVEVAIWQCLFSLLVSLMGHVYFKTRTYGN